MTRNEGHVETMPAAPAVLGFGNAVVEREFMKKSFEMSGISSGGAMCRHKQIELIARIENYMGHKSINLYSCKDCNQTLVMKNRKTPVPLNGEFRNRKALEEFALAV